MCLKFLQELEVEVELLKEDNEQLVTQYEREKVNNNDTRFCRVMDSTQLIRGFYREIPKDSRSTCHFFPGDDDDDTCSFCQLVPP